MALGAKLKEAREQRKLTPSEVAAATRMKVQIVEDLDQENFSRIAAPVYGKGFIKLYAEFVGLNPKPLIDEYVARFVDPPPSGGHLGGEITFEELGAGAAEEESELSEDSPFGLGDETEHGEPDLFSHAANQGEKPFPARDTGNRLSDWIGKLKRAVRSVRLERRLDVVDDSSVDADTGGADLGEEYAKYAEDGESPPGYSPSRIGLVAVGILLIVLFFVSCFRQCRQGSVPGDSASAGDVAPAKLEVALEPEEPYID